MKIFKFFLASFICFVCSTTTVHAENNQFATIVNPVRISKYNKIPGESLASEYNVIKNHNLPATWLLTYDAITNSEIQKIVSTFDDSQELGIFLEITSNFAAKAQVEYHDTDHWHHATSVFLSGYTQKERKKLIKTVFDEFKNKFGYYPKSIGSWWTDSFSLEFIKNNYNIAANLGVADQFSTDGYQVWGQYWSTPFYPSKLHAAIPANNESIKLDVVTMQWAPRDPIKGYFESQYSAQDYLLTKEGLKTPYFKKLVTLYTQRENNPFGHIVVGLESDLSPQTYNLEYKNQIEYVKSISDQVTILNMKDFAKFYKESFPNLSPNHFLQSKSLITDSNIEVFWFQSPFYRIRIKLVEGQVQISDLRSYYNNYQEPYYFTPNSEFKLLINTPYLIDQVNEEKSIWNLNLGAFRDIDNSSNLGIIFDKGKIVLSDKKFEIHLNNIAIPDSITQSKFATVLQKNNVTSIEFNNTWDYSPDGYTFNSLSPEASHLLRNKKLIFLASIVLIVLILMLLKLPTNKFTKLLLLTATFVIISFYGYSWYQNNLNSYFVSQQEIDTLNKLTTLPSGKVLVYDQECLQCDWFTAQPPASFYNKRNYVKVLSGHQIVKNQKVFSATDQVESRKQFDKLNVSFIYLVKYNDYIEKIPFSPGDLDLKLIHENANSQLWKVKN